MGEESEKIDKEEPKVADVPKKPRGRKKLKYQTLRKQMEFYFSDANLSKDRFLGQLIQESQYVELNVFLRFNRIKSITSNIKDIVNALQSSDLLKVTECGTKVYRVKPVETKTNSEECTIYVENIPAKADHDYLRNIFSSYGLIDYVSIPRFKHSQMNKGFAFIEFKHSESVEKAVTAFKGFGSHLLDKIEPAELCSIKTFIEEKELEKAEYRRTHHNKTYDDTNPYLGDDNVIDEVNDDNENSANEEKKGKKKKNLDLEAEPEIKKTKTEQLDPGCHSAAVYRRTHHNKTYDDTNPYLGDDNVIDELNDDKTNETVCSDENSANEEKQGKKRKNLDLEAEPEVKRTKTEKLDPSSCKAKRKISSGSDQETSETEPMKHRKAESSADQPTKKMKKEQSDDSVAGSSETDGKEKKKKRLLSSGDSEAAAASDAENVRIKKQSDEVSADEASHEEKGNREKDHLHNQETDEILAKESSNNEDEVGDFDSERKKKHRKRKKKSKREKACSGLQVLTKKEWKVMRNRYLMEQRKRMSNLKKHLEQKRWEYYNSTKEDQIEETDETEVKEEEEETTSNEKFSDVRVSYLPGVIVKIQLDEPLVDKDSFKNELKRKPEIKYIDVKECSNIVHLRFASSDGAQQFVQNSPWQGTTVLEGSEEQDYWDKVWKDREHKINKNIRKPKNGRKKLLEKAENMRSMHVRFD